MLTSVPHHSRVVLTSIAQRTTAPTRLAVSSVRATLELLANTAIFQVGDIPSNYCSIVHKTTVSFYEGQGYSEKE
jgi:hypothetical protein